MRCLLFIVLLWMAGCSGEEATPPAAPPEIALPTAETPAALRDPAPQPAAGTEDTRTDEERLIAAAAQIAMDAQALLLQDAHLDSYGLDAISFETLGYPTTVRGQHETEAGAFDLTNTGAELQIGGETRRGARVEIVLRDATPGGFTLAVEHPAGGDALATMQQAAEAAKQQMEHAFAERYRAWQGTQVAPDSTAS